MTLKQRSIQEDWCWQFAERWLMRLQKRRDWHRLDSTTRLQCILGLAICYRFWQNPETAEALEHRVVQLERIQLTKVNPMLLGTLVRFLNTIGLPCTDLRKLEQQCNDFYQACQSPPSKVVLAALTRVVKRDLTRELDAYFVGVREFLLLDDAGLRLQCDLWSAVTDWGEDVLSPCLSARAKSLEIAMSAVMLWACRSYRLDIAAQLLRVMVWLCLETSMIIDGATFLACQQRADGSFGFLNPLLPEYDQLSRDRHLRIHLPFTVTVLWALAEVVRRDEKGNGG